MKTEKNRTGIVRKMREIRDEVSSDIMDMSLVQEKDYIQKQLSELKKKRQSRPSY